MINLLPPELKSGYSYARRNVRLRNWIIAFVIALVGLGAVGTYGMLNLHQSTLSYQKQVNNSQNILTTEDLAGTQKNIQDISNSFKLVVKVLGQEILFSKLLNQIGAAIPANANLTGLSIQDTSGGLDIDAEATDYSTASQVQVNLADPKNRIFSKADIISITCNRTETNYPCIVKIRALFAPDNPFLFINSKGTVKK
jgi:hypothetical protein